MVLLRAFGHRKNDKFISYINSTNFLVVQNNCSDHEKWGRSLDSGVF